jgi:hypothetical protein
MAGWGRVALQLRGGAVLQRPLVVSCPLYLRIRGPGCPSPPSPYPGPPLCSLFPGDVSSLPGRGSCSIQGSGAPTRRHRRLAGLVFGVWSTLCLCPSPRLHLRHPPAPFPCFTFCHQHPLTQPPSLAPFVSFPLLHSAAASCAVLKRPSPPLLDCRPPLACPSRS